MMAPASFLESNSSVEEIQDIVEEVLLVSPFKKIAEVYILYRDRHARVRSMVELRQTLPYLGLTAFG